MPQVQPLLTVTPVDVQYKEIPTQHNLNRVFPTTVVDEGPLYKVVMLYRHYNHDEKVVLCQTRDEVRKKLSWLFRHNLRPFAIYERIANGWKLVFEHRIDPFCIECGVFLYNGDHMWGMFWHDGFRVIPVDTPRRVPYWTSTSFTHRVICARCKDPEIWANREIPPKVLNQLIWRNNERPMIVREIET